MKHREHQKWAQKMGLPLEVAKYVDKLIDMPEKVPKYRDLYTRLFAEALKNLNSLKNFLKRSLMIKLRNGKV
jgi:hypothetical protein